MNSIFLILLFIAFARCDQFYFNNTAYETTCLSPNSTCSPFVNASLWIPAGVPGFNSTVVVSSSTPITLLVPLKTVVIIYKLSLIGNVKLDIRGSILFDPTNSASTAIVVCDNSSVSIQDDGVLAGSAGFFDNTTLRVLGNGTALIPALNVTNSFTSFHLRGNGFLSMALQLGTINLLNISGKAKVSGGDITVANFYISEYARASTFSWHNIFITTYGQFLGSSYRITGLYISSSNVTFDGCPLATSVTLSNSFVIFNSDYCTINNLVMGGALDQISTNKALFIGNSAFNFSSIAMNSPGLVSFSQTIPTSTNVTIKSGDSVMFSFNGDYTVTGGDTSNTLAVAGVYATGSLILEGAICIEGFDWESANFILSCPSWGCISFYNLSVNIYSPKLLWYPGGTVQLNDYATINTPTITLNEGRVLALNNAIPGTSIEASNFTISKDSSLRILQSGSIQIPQIYLDGTVEFAQSPNTEFVNKNLTIYGNLTVSQTGLLNFHEHISTSNTYIGSFLQVLGEVHLNGILAASLNGSLPDIDSFKDILIPVANATNFYGDFESFTGALLVDNVPDQATAIVSMDYRIANNTVYLHYHIETTQQSNGLKLWQIIAVAGGGGGLLLVAIIVGVVIVRRRNQHKYTLISGQM